MREGETEGEGRRERERERERVSASERRGPALRGAGDEGGEAEAGKVACVGWSGRGLEGGKRAKGS